MMTLNTRPTIVQRCKIAAKGLLIGVGVGLQMCDYIDLMGGDYTALYGWRNGIVMGAIVGTTIGFVKATDSSRVATPTFRLWLLILSLCMFNPSIVLLLNEQPTPFLVGWCKTMIACGVVYGTLGIVIQPRVASGASYSGN